KSLDKTIKDGVRQTLEYMDRCGTDEGHLVIFDRTRGKSWEEKIFRRDGFGQNEKTAIANTDSTNIDNTKLCKDKKIVVWGM
ncbi:MAG: hypothetical protein HQK61_07590, partial [Desulfamplus sp.]|nr:hypothetical protein [Desulfamplus sp.]